MGIARSLSKNIAPAMSKAAPRLGGNIVQEALRRAISGVGPLPGAAAAADKALREAHGNADRAIHDLIETHVRYAGVQGFATNIGGMVTVAVTIPANITGLALVECRLVAGIAHLRGYDLDDQRVRNAILTCLLGEDSVRKMVRRKKLPSTPMGIATAPTRDPQLDQVIAAEVTGELLSKVAGKRLATSLGRHVPVVGGLVGAGADGYTTWQIGRYADREMRPRSRR